MTSEQVWVLRDARGDVIGVSVTDTYYSQNITRRAMRTIAKQAHAMHRVSDGTFLALLASADDLSALPYGYTLQLEPLANPVPSAVVEVISEKAKTWRGVAANLGAGLAQNQYNRCAHELESWLTTTRSGL